MRVMRLALCAAAFAIVVGVAVSEDMDIRALQAKLAAQEARLNDLQAKMGAADCDEGVVADGITTLRKNATITLGGTVNTRYFYRSGKIKSTVVRPGYYQDLGGGNYQWVNTGSAPGTMDTVARAKGGDLFMADAKLEGKIDVNEYFDAYFKFDLQSSSPKEHSDNAEQFWVRWKNVCNSGFGILVGRDDLKYGMGPSVGVLDSWSAGSDTNGYGGMFESFIGGGLLEHPYPGVPGPVGINAMIHESGTPIPVHTGWDNSRVNQITPYWENSDGSFKAELSFFQDIDQDANDWMQTNAGGVAKYRMFRNDGIGSMSGRITWQPFEGLTLVASAINQYNKYATSTVSRGDGVWGRAGNKNNFAASLGFEWTPTFLCDKLTLWGYYQHGWNESWVDNLNTDLVNAGVMYKFTDQFYAFAQGDYLYAKDADVADITGNIHKAKGWAGYVGMGYELPYGANFEVGYRHEKVDYKNRAGEKHTKYKGDTIYAHLGFNF